MLAVGRDASTTASRSRSSSRTRGTSRSGRRAAVRVEHEPLPAVFTVAGALAPDAPLVQDPSLRPGDPLAGTNVLAEHRVDWGDLDAEAGRAALVVEASYRFPMVTQFAIEPHAFMAAPDDDGLVVWSTIQHPNWLQRVIAGHGRDAAVAGPRDRARPGRRVRRQAAREVRAGRRVRRAPARPARAARPEPRGDVPGRPPRGVRDERPDRLRRRRRDPVRGHRARTT